METAPGEHWTAAEARAALTAGPVATLDELVPAQSLLVVAPHPDDETLGCGGLIGHATQAGRRVVVACLSDGAASHPRSRTWPPARLATLRRGELAEALAILGGEAVRVEAFDAPDGRLETCETSAGAWLQRIAVAHGCGVVFTTWIADPHPDHKAAFRIAAGVAGRMAVPLFAYPIWGLVLPDAADAGPAGPCHRLDISQMSARKRAAVMAFRSQTGELIDDDPEGFRLGPEDLARHLRPHEGFIRIGCAPPPG